MLLFIYTSNIDRSDTTVHQYQEENIATRFDDQISFKGNFFENVSLPTQSRNIYDHDDVQTPIVRKSGR